MSGNDDRGWNIKLGKARSTPVAWLLGGSKGGLPSIGQVALLTFLLLATGRIFGLI